MTAHHIRYEIDADGVGRLTIDRPEKRNAMTYAMLAEFTARAKAAAADPALRVLIVSGTGGAFCAGTDLADLATVPGETRGVRGGAHEHGAWWPLFQVPCPVIAAVDGHAVGMGAEMTSQCDVRIVTDRARFAWNFAHRGLVPDTGAGSWLLPRLVGPQRALRLLYSGLPMGAQEALDIGYAAQMVAPDKLEDAAREEAERYLASSPMSLRKIKQLVWKGMERGIDAHMADHVEAMKACFKSADHKEGVAAFLEKRPAKFVGA